VIEDVLGGSSTTKVLDFVIDLRRPYTQKEVCERTRLSKPTVVKTFNTLLNLGLIKKSKTGYQTNFDSEALKHLIRFDLSLTYYLAKKQRDLNQ
jgi:predicted transcriptional regulator